MDQRQGRHPVKMFQIAHHQMALRVQVAGMHRRRRQHRVAREPLKLGQSMIQGFPSAQKGTVVVSEHDHIQRPMLRTGLMDRQGYLSGLKLMGKSAQVLQHRGMGGEKLLWKKPRLAASQHQSGRRLFQTLEQSPKMSISHDKQNCARRRLALG